MNMKSVNKLYLVKQMVACALVDNEEVRDRIIEEINSVLIEEAGAAAVLYPYNQMNTEILALWKEHMAPKEIALKLGLDEDVVSSFLEAQGD